MLVQYWKLAAQYDIWQLPNKHLRITVADDTPVVIIIMFELKVSWIMAYWLLIADLCNLAPHRQRLSLASNANGCFLGFIFYILCVWRTRTSELWWLYGCWWWWTIYHSRFVSFCEIFAGALIVSIGSVVGPFVIIIYARASGLREIVESLTRSTVDLFVLLICAARVALRLTYYLQYIVIRCQFDEFLGKLYRFKLCMHLISF